MYKEYPGATEVKGTVKKLQTGLSLLEIPVGQDNIHFLEVLSRRVMEVYADIIPDLQLTICLEDDYKKRVIRLRAKEINKYRKEASEMDMFCLAAWFGFRVATEKDFRG